MSRIALTLPAGSTEPKFWLDRLPLKPERIREARPNSGEYLLDIGALLPEPEPVLTVQFGDPNCASSCGLIGSHTLVAPAFPDNTSVESTVWEVTLPFEQYLYLGAVGCLEFRSACATPRYGTDARLRKPPTSTAGWAGRTGHGGRRQYLRVQPLWPR